MNTSPNDPADMPTLATDQYKEAHPDGAANTVSTGLVAVPDEMAAFVASAQRASLTMPSPIGRELATLRPRYVALVAGHPDLHQLRDDELADLVADALVADQQAGTADDVTLFSDIPMDHLQSFCKWIKYHVKDVKDQADQWISTTDPDMPQRMLDVVRARQEASGLDPDAAGQSEIVVFQEEFPTLLANAPALPDGLTVNELISRLARMARKPDIDDRTLRREQWRSLFPQVAAPQQSVVWSGKSDTAPAPTSTDEPASPACDGSTRCPATQHAPGCVFRQVADWEGAIDSNGQRMPTTPGTPWPPVIGIQPAQGANQKRPKPYYINPDGTVRRQDYWKGTPAQLAGFQEDLDVMEVDVLTADWQADDPQAVIGMYPVFVNADGSTDTLKAPVESVTLYPELDLEAK